jgi:hypothetical protein
VGSFTEAEARPLDALELLPPRAAVRDLVAIAVDDATAVRIGHGSQLERPDGDGPWVMLDAGGAVLAVYEAHGATSAKPAVVLASG